MKKLRVNIISSISGWIIGLVSGLVGVGGGEFRAPVLVYLLERKVKFAIAANLLIGVLVVSVSFIRREGYMLPTNILLICFIFIIFSLVGSYLGAIWTKKRKDIFLIRALGVLLVVASIKVFLDSGEIYSLHLELNILSISLAIIFGFLIGTLSGFLGVAGGEFRIPALLLIFGLPIKIAGTANLLISIPTVLIGFLKHKNLGHVDKNNLTIAAIMGIFSMIGAFIGATLMFLIHDDILFVVLAIIMFLAGVKMLVKP